MVYFAEAIEKDPKYALAYAGLADCFNIIGLYGFIPSKEAGAKAKAAAENALQLDDQLAEAHFSMALIRYFLESDLQKADEEFQHTLTLNPNAHVWYAVLLASLGNREEAFDEVRRGYQLEPFSPTINSVAGWAMYAAGWMDKSIQYCQNAFEIDVGFEA